MRYKDYSEFGGHRILVFPANAPEMAGRTVFFLFSLKQVEAVVHRKPVRQIPFAPDFVLGVAQWEKQVLPVISLERCLGIGDESSESAFRMAVLHIGEGMRCMITAGTGMHLIPFPRFYAPVSEPGRIRGDLIHGMYEWPEGLIVVADMRKILRGDLEMNGQTIG